MCFVYVRTSREKNSIKDKFPAFLKTRRQATYLPPVVKSLQEQMEGERSREAAVRTRARARRVVNGSPPGTHPHAIAQPGSERAKKQVSKTTTLD